MADIYTEKEILGDALAAQKAATGEFNTFANECVHEDVRQTGCIPVYLNITDGSANLPYAMI